jgi:DNA recombination protein RmuC
LVLAFALVVLVTLMAVVLWRARAGGARFPSFQSLEDLAALRAQLHELEGAQGRLLQSLSGVQGAVQGVETKVVESSAGVRDALGRDVQETRLLLERLKADADARHRLEEEVQASARRIESVLVGARTRGLTGEHILDDAFRLFPPQMIEANFRVNGKTVEYALVLANNKRLPIDSKWAAADLVERLAEANLEPAIRAALLAEVEKVLRTKVREVRQYIDSELTLPWAVAAVPDAVFALCRQAHLDAYREDVVLMPYSMTVPYLLAIYRLHLQYARTIDVEHLEAYLQQIERGLDELDRVLENQITRGATMVANGYLQSRTSLGHMRSALGALRSAPAALDEVPGSEGKVVALAAVEGRERSL